MKAFDGNCWFIGVLKQGITGPTSANCGITIFHNADKLTNDPSNLFRISGK